MYVILFQECVRSADILLLLSVSVQLSATNYDTPGFVHYRFPAELAGPSSTSSTGYYTE